MARLVAYRTGYGRFKSYYKRFNIAVYDVKCLYRAVNKPVYLVKCLIRRKVVYKAKKKYKINIKEEAF